MVRFLLSHQAIGLQKANGLGHLPEKWFVDDGAFSGGGKQQKRFKTATKCCLEV